MRVLPCRARRKLSLLSPREFPAECTIKKYLFRIFHKPGISGRVELVLYTVNHGDR